MSGEDYAALPTDRLLEMFVDAARRFRLGRSQLARLQYLRDPLAPKLDDDLEARKPAAAQLWATSIALRERQPVAEAERMMEDDDPDIRATAAAFLGGLSPEWADAAAKGFQAMLPTREVLALQRRARQAPPERPTLEEMSDDELVARFEDAAQRERGANLLDYLENDDDKDVQNRIVSEVWDIMRQLKARGLLARLLPLFASDNPTVRREAATACLRIAEAQAIDVLEAIARNEIYGDGFAARSALARWRKEGTIVYGV
jgi:hypothetical protein